MATMLAALLVMYALALMVEKCSNEAPLKQKLARVEEELYKVRNESKIVKREAEQKLKSAGLREAAATAEAAAAAASAAAAAQQQQQVVTNEPPEHLLQELESLKVRCIPNFDLMQLPQP